MSNTEIIILIVVLFLVFGGGAFTGAGEDRINKNRRYT